MSKLLDIFEKCNCDEKERKEGVCKKCGLPIAKGASDFMGKGRNGKKCACDCKDKKDMKESKFEKYLVEEKLIEEANIILEKLGSLDAVDASELGVPANTPITFSSLENAFKKYKGNAESFINKVKAKFQGISPKELEVLKNAISLPTGTQGDEWGRNPKRADN